ncbi:type 2 periplasmic-binding domain-containing protein [Hespellia stercorisuis]|uniref:NitT/TauT family transport system substrate-binding protein n=1 Tax=Hespellia stercorisuis DSM 15480 TaxID=1121950 RepID=A0A1M6TSD8_9FIRM|nr:ABC transporter substrate-binding protein [Hespellia stercorisuis]SHK59820.1 NitT/TauT family transport system substrate-binding protein [Hespellia stercorisuis DSM 15480]
MIKPTDCAVLNLILRWCSLFPPTVEFEPSATKLEQEGSGYVVASLGVDSGFVPYTDFCAKTSYINAHPDVIQNFTNALQKGLQYCQGHDAAQIATVILPQFDDMDSKTLTTIVSRYQDQDTWKNDLIFTEEAFDLMQDILESAGELKERVPYEKLVTTEFAEVAAEN